MGMKFGYWAVFVVGLLIVLLSSAEAFDQASYKQQPGKPYTRMKPKFVTLRKQYRKALSLYLLIVFYLYSFLALLPGLGRALIPGVGQSKGFPANIINDPMLWPLVVASAMLGFQNALGLKRLDQFMRSKLHKLARIPEGARDTIDSLHRSGFNFTQYDSPGVLKQKEFGHVNREDFYDESHRLENRWAKACCVLYNLRNSRESNECGPGGFDHTCYDRDFFHEYDTEYDEIVTLHRGLFGSMARYSELKEAESEGDVKGFDRLEESLNRDVDVLLERIYSFIACGVRAKQSTESQVLNVLNRLGFSLSSSAPPLRTDWKSVLKAAGITGVVVVAGGLSAIVVFPHALRGIPPQQLERIEYLQTGPAFALLWGVCAFCFMIAATSSALAFRRNRMRRGRWVVPEYPGADRPIWHYFLASLIGGLAAYGVLLVVCTFVEILASVFDPMRTLALRTFVLKLLILSAWMIPAGVTSCLAVYAFDTRYDEGKAPRRATHVLLWACLTTSSAFLSAWVYTDLWHRVILKTRIDNVMTIQLMYCCFICIMMLAIGGFMGYFFPGRAFTMHFKPLCIFCRIDGEELPAGVALREGDRELGRTGEWITFFRRPHNLRLGPDPSGKEWFFELNPAAVQGHTVDISF